MLWRAFGAFLLVITLGLASCQSFWWSIKVPVMSDAVEDRGFEHHV